MFANIINFIVWGSIVVALVSCNIYAPFGSKSSETDYIEEAQKCLHDGDFACAIDNYNGLPNGELKSQKLCLVYLAKAGFTLSALVSTVKQNSVTMMGSLSQALAPWDATKQADAASAVTHCAAFQGFSTSGQSGLLLKNLSLLVDCATLMAKADQLAGNAAADTTCTTAGNRDGRVTKSDIDDGTRFMCKTDVDSCYTDLTTMNTSQFGADLSELKTSFNTVIAGVVGSGGATNNVRAELKNNAVND